MDKGEIAKNYFLKGYNCAQSVALAFQEELKLDSVTIARIASPFGGGFGRAREVCGAVSGGSIVLGLLLGYSSPTNREEKKNTYALERKFMDMYKEENGSYICRELLSGITKDDTPIPSERTKEYYKKRPCPELVEMSANLVEKILEENKDKIKNKTEINIF